MAIQWRCLMLLLVFLYVAFGDEIETHIDKVWLAFLDSVHPEQPLHLYILIEIYYTV